MIYNPIVWEGLGAKYNHLAIRFSTQLDMHYRNYLEIQFLIYISLTLRRICHTSKTHSAFPTMNNHQSSHLFVLRHMLEQHAF